MSYKHLSQTERYQIYALMKAGHLPVEIAKLLGRHKSSISRELSRNTGKRGYRPQQADQRYQERGQSSRNARRVDEATRALVAERLSLQWSPEQIAASLPISHETIYQHVYADKAQGGSLWKQLRCQKKKRKRYATGRERRGQIVGRRPIAQRPASVQTRRQVGHWEGFSTVLNRIDAQRRLSMTYDQGKEMSQHEKLSERTGVKVYFADPHSPWQRGINENTNGLLRQYLPKGIDLSVFSQDELDSVAWALNTRPRKSLGFKCPATLFLPDTFNADEYYRRLVALHT